MVPCVVAIGPDEDATAEHYVHQRAVVLNDRLRGDADVFVDWTTIAAEPAVLAPDGIHATALGYQRRAEACRRRGPLGREP